MEKQRQPQRDEESSAVEGPDYLTLVIEWDELADSIEYASTVRGTIAAIDPGMGISDDNPDWNRVDEASLESFPASDPPAWGSSHAVATPGVPEDLADEVTQQFEPRSQMSALRRIVLGVAAVAAIVSFVEGLRRLRLHQRARA